MVIKSDLEKDLYCQLNVTIRLEGFLLSNF